MKLYEELIGCNTIAISGHIRPDGDCVGSVMGTYLYLRKEFPDATIIPMIEKPANVFNCIKDIDVICSSFEPEVNVFDAFIVLDCSTLDRLGDAGNFYNQAKKKIVIDHHISNDGFGDVSYIDGKASSTCELVYDCIDLKKLDRDIALALYIGIIHDTGVLQYSCTSAKTLRTVASLIEYDFDFPAIIDETFYEKTKLQNVMLGKGLSDAMFYLEGKVIASKIDLNTINSYGATSHDFEGIVNQLRYTKGVEVAVFMYELEDDFYKVSMRSRGAVDVAKIAKYFDGGGHKRAAGVSLNGTYEEIINKLVKEISLQL